MTWTRNLGCLFLLPCVLVFALSRPAAAQMLLNQYNAALPDGGGSTNITTTPSSFLLDDARYTSDHLVDGDFRSSPCCSGGPNGEEGGDLGPNGFLEHTTDVDGFMWVAHFGPPTNQFVSLSFTEGPQAISTMRIWNQNEITSSNGNNQTDRGVRDMWVWLSNDDTLPGITAGPGDANPGPGWTEHGQVTLAQAPGTAYDGESFLLGFTAQHVLFMIDTNYGDPTLTGLSEVQFFGSGSVGPPPTIFEWRTDGTGEWDTNSNWSPSSATPTTKQRTAVFGEMISRPTTVVTNVPITVNQVEFNNPTHRYGVAGLGSVNLEADTGGGLPSVAVMQGNHQFQVNVNLQDDTLADISSGASVEFNNRLNLMGKMLTKTGDGDLAINNILNAGGGTVNVLAGSVSGGGTVGGDLDNSGGTVAPGNSAGAPSQVPEPATWLLLGIGLVGFLGYLRRRAK